MAAASVAAMAPTTLEMLMAQDMANHCAPEKTYKRPSAVASSVRLARMVSVFMTESEPEKEIARQRDRQTGRHGDRRAVSPVSNKVDS